MQRCNKLFGRYRVNVGGPRRAYAITEAARLKGLIGLHSTKARRSPNMTARSDPQFIVEQLTKRHAEQ